MNTQLLANILGYSAAAIGAVMFLPQAIDVWKTKRTKAISLTSFSLFTFVSILWFCYGLLTHAMPVIIVNAVLTVLNGFIVVMKLKYK